jgi:hypothetical protein
LDFPAAPPSHPERRSNQYAEAHGIMADSKKRAMAMNQERKTIESVRAPIDSYRKATRPRPATGHLAANVTKLFTEVQGLPLPKEA